MLNAADVNKKKAEIKAAQEKGRQEADQLALDKYLEQVEKVVLASIDNFTTVYKPTTVSARAQKALEDAGYKVFDNGNSFLIRWNVAVAPVAPQVFPCDDGCMCRQLEALENILLDEDFTVIEPELEPEPPTPPRRAARRRSK
jgi:hypothetical protein